MYPLAAFLSRLAWPERKYLVLFSGFLLHVTYGSIYTFGNLTTYMTSYRRSLDPNVTYTEAMWIQAISFATTGVALPLGGYLDYLWGPRITTLLGAILMSIGVFLTSLAINHSLGMVMLTYGLLYGTGARLGYIAPISVAMKWFPERHHGKVNGVIVAGYGLGAFVFNFVQRAYVNPDNVPADSSGYFVDADVLRRVPSLFLLLGGTYLAVQLFASIFLTNPPVTIEHEEASIIVEENKKGSIRREVILSPLFFALWLTFLFNDQAIMAITGLYKAFGLHFPWMDDDIFLTLVGSLGSIANAGGRLLWGILADHSDYKTLMVALTWLVTTLLLSLNATPFGGKWLYASWIILINAVTPGSYILLPKAISLYFGNQDVALHYSLLFTNFLVGGPLSALVSNVFLNYFGWIGVFWSTAIFSAAAGAITLRLPRNS